MCTGQRQRMLGKGVSLLQAAGQQLRLSQGETTAHLIANHCRCNGPFQCLHEQRQRVGDAPAQSIRCT